MVAASCALLPGAVLQRTSPGGSGVDGPEGRLELTTGGPWPVPGAQDTALGVYIGDVWLLAGQSNLEGRGRLTTSAGRGRDDVRVKRPSGWTRAEHPLHCTCPSELVPACRAAASGALVDGEHGAFQPGHGVGPGLAFGLELSARLDVPVGLLPCAVAATGTRDWAPDLPDGLHERTCREAVASGGRLAGIIWHQGESDALGHDLDGYEDRTHRILDRFRQRVHVQREVVVQAGRWVTAVPDPRADVSWSRLREAQRSVARDRGAALVATVDLPLGDSIHLDAAAQETLGRRLAGAVVDPDRVPRVDRVRAVDSTHVLLETTPALRPGSTLPGLTWHAPDGSVVPSGIVSADAARDGVLVQLRRPAVRGEGLAWAWGTDPRAGPLAAAAALPAFGPVVPDA